MSLTITSPAFREGQPIPAKFTCKGDDVSPEIRIAGVPPAAKGITVIFDDPDAPRGRWTHWTFWDLPPATRVVGQGEDVTALGATEGKTSANSTGYHGPCPPSGTHRYVFHVFATREPLRLSAGTDVEQVWRSVRASALAQGQLMGRFSKD